MPHHAIGSYLKQIAQVYNQGNATEHSYRADLQHLVQEMAPDITVTNEPKRQACGAPDYVLYRGDVPAGYIETKDIPANLNEIEKTEQLRRYLTSLDNLILTDYLTFRRYSSGVLRQEVAIAAVENGAITARPATFDSLAAMIGDFCDFRGQTITSANRLATIMANKTRLMKEVLLQTIKQSGEENESEEENALRDQLLAVKEILIHDISEQDFADMYAQTIAYGLFAARLHDRTLDDFSRQEAQALLPGSNPFLKNLFGYISSVDVDQRVVWIIDELCAVFRATDVNAIIMDYTNEGTDIDRADPYLHFYETFLAQYNPKLRKAAGVYYTPASVVSFIVGAVDDTLKAEFGVGRGLADTEKITHTITEQEQTRSTEVHRVQILDPAAGTGTFMAEVIRNIYRTFERQQGNWPNYVQQHLLPRLNGFEILMAPYAMCHLRLELLLRETGYAPTRTDGMARFHTYLTNTLEEAKSNERVLFASWLTKEAQAAQNIKNNTPIMVVIGNPPYSGISTNKGDWITNKIEDYKYVDGTHFGEKKHWLQDDYVKFIRFGEHCIEKNSEGILAYINNHSFLDNPTFRGMRWHLLQTFDTIYIIDLHGNAKKKEHAPDGGIDENVFDIQQGVSINLFIKTGKNQPASWRRCGIMICTVRERKNIIFSTITAYPIFHLRHCPTKPHTILWYLRILPNKKNTTPASQ